MVVSELIAHDRQTSDSACHRLAEQFSHRSAEETLECDMHPGLKYSCLYG